MTTIKEEILNMIGMNCNFEFKVDSLDFLIDDVYQWHIQQQIKLLEEVISYADGENPTSRKEIREFLDSKITNLK